jgi:Cu(I)/Ag(I) efflux system membrane protein CusA/SilA
VLIESIVNRIEAVKDKSIEEEPLLETIYQATTEVASAVITAVATTVISFIPVFTMEAAEGKLFKPLAYTKTFALVASIMVAIMIIPPLAHSLFSLKWKWSNQKLSKFSNNGKILLNVLCALWITYFLATLWMPLGVNKSALSNFFFVAIIAGMLLSFLYCIIYFYENILRFLLRFKILFLLLVGFIVYQGVLVFQNTGQEFMPSLDEGSFLLMPTSMPHAGMEENIKNLRLLDMAVTAIPEVETVVGKAGRVNSPLDPAPMSMYENVILYKSEYKTDENGHRIRFQYENGEYIKTDKGELIPDENGRYFRQWRDEIQSPDDIWNEITKATKLPGVTSAPKLQPIETRLVMLQTGMRAPMGIKVSGSDLATIEAFGLELEKHLKEVKGVKDAAVFADRIVGKPYLLLDINRETIARYGLTIETVQQHIQAAIGGMTMTSTVEGRERYAIRIRYPRELRNDPEMLKQIYIPTATGQQIPLGQLVEIKYEQGAQAIKSEDGFLIGFVLFDKENGQSEVEVVNRAQAYLSQQIDEGNLEIPTGINYRFAGSYEQQVRASERLNLVVPIALVLIFLILYFQFKSVTISLMVFTGVFIAFAGGFIMIGLYDTDWFLNFDFFGKNMRDLFQIQTVNLSVAVWVGFLALFGIATDDGVLVATFLKDSFQKNEPQSIPEIRDAVVEGGLRRVRPAVMTTATTILALLPVLASTGRGSDIMLPMAIPSFGGMTLQIITMFTVPVLYSLWKEWKWRWRNRKGLKNKGVAASILLMLSLLIGGSSASAQSLDELLTVANDNNLDLKILASNYRAALEKAPQVSQLPDPEIGIGAFPLPVETRLGAQVFRASATQMFPWKGVLDSRENLELAKAKAIYKKIAVRQLTLHFQVKKAWLELYELEKSKTIIERNLTLLNTLDRLALTKVESGKATAADVLRLQLKTTELKQELAILETKKSKPLASINQLLNRPLDTPIEVTDSLDFAIIPFQKDTLTANIRANHPMVQLLKLQQKAAEQAIKVSQLDGKPSFGVGLDYIMVNERDDAMLSGNGRDILQIRGTVKIPLYRQKYAAKEREEQFKIAALNDEKENVVAAYLAEIERAYADYETAQLRVNLYQKQVEITKAALNILETKYSADGNSFDELLQLEKELIDYDLKTLKAIVDSHLAKYKVEQFITF